MIKRSLSMREETETQIVWLGLVKVSLEWISLRSKTQRQVPVEALKWYRLKSSPTNWRDLTESLRSFGKKKIRLLASELQFNAPNCLMMLPHPYSIHKNLFSWLIFLTISVHWFLDVWKNWLNSTLVEELSLKMILLKEILTTVWFQIRFKRCAWIGSSSQHALERYLPESILSLLLFLATNSCKGVSSNLTCLDFLKWLEESQNHSVLATLLLISQELATVSIGKPKITCWYWLTSPLRLLKRLLWKATINVKQMTSISAYLSHPSIGCFNALDTAPTKQFSLKFLNCMKIANTKKPSICNQSLDTSQVRSLPVPLPLCWAALKNISQRKRISWDWLRSWVWPCWILHQRKTSQSLTILTLDGSAWRHLKMLIYSSNAPLFW